MEKVRETVEQAIVPLKAELIWFFILILAITGGIVGMKTTYKSGYERGMQDMRISILEDFQIATTERERNDR